MSYYKEQFIAAVLASEEAEAAATKRRAQLLKRITSDFERTGRTAMRNIATPQDVLDAHLSRDPTWKKHVSANQWQIARATMYGIGALLESLDVNDGTDDEAENSD